MISALTEGSISIFVPESPAVVLILRCFFGELRVRSQVLLDGVYIHGVEGGPRIKFDEGVVMVVSLGTGWTRGERLLVWGLKAF